MWDCILPKSRLSHAYESMIPYLLQNADYGLAVEWLEKALETGGDRVYSYLQLYKDLAMAYKNVSPCACI